jgi:Ca-activated chloride channel family protein
MVLVLGGVAGCGEDEKPAPKGGAAVATLQVVRPAVSVVRGGERSRATWSARVGAGDRVETDRGRAWLHHDGGLRALLGDGAAVRVGAKGLTLKRGRIWVEAPAGAPGTVTVGDVQVSASRAGFEVRQARRAAGAGQDAAPPRVLVARGHVEVRRGEQVVEVRAGQKLRLDATGAGKGPAKGAGKGPSRGGGHGGAGGGGVGLPAPTGVTLWTDWTGGLAWPAPDAPAAPPGMGEIGARRPGSLGKASFPLAVRSLDVKTRIQGDLATTVVDQRFFNPASEDLEGVYRVRLPPGAMLHAFCIDRPQAASKLVCGYVKERQAARKTYRSKVYAGSTEDPALLEWEAPGRYKAHLYPLKAGATRRVVILYSEWLTRQGERRRWRYPMGGPADSAPLVQELRLEVDVEGSGAERVEAGLGATVDGHAVVLQRSDFRPRADFVLALHGGGQTGAARAYVGDKRTAEGRYLMVRLAPSALERRGDREGLDLALVVDTSADTDPSELQLARATVAALLGHLGPDDRVAVLGADLDVQAAAGDEPALQKVTPQRVQQALDRLARRPVGGATDLGRVLTAAAGLLQKGREGAVVYIGDGVPTVGELDAAALSKRLARLARPVRLYGVAVGPEADLGLLKALASGHGGLAERVTVRAEAARAALQLASHASRPALHRLKIDLGPKVERVFPARAVTAVAGQDLVVLGRLRGGAPKAVTLSGWYRGREVSEKLSLSPQRVDDEGDLRRRWASARLDELLAGGAGREEVAELGTRFDLITAHTSIYVPSAGETPESTEQKDKLRQTTRRVKQELARQARTSRRREAKRRAKRRYRPQSLSASRAADQKSTASAMSAPNREAEADNGPEATVASEAAPAPPASAPKADKSKGATGKVEDRVAALGAGPARPRYRASAKRRRRPRKNRSRKRRKKRALDGLFGSEGVGNGGGGGGGGGVGIGGGGSGSGRDSTTTFSTDSAAPGDAREGKDGGAARGLADEEARRPAGPRGGAGRGELAKEKTGRWGGFRRGYRTAVRHRVDVHVHLHRGKKHRPKRCSPASLQPLSRRRALWRERLRRKRSVTHAREIWIDALRHCEAPRWQDRRTLLQEILNRLGAVRHMVGFARRARPYLGWGAWRYLRRAVYARLRTAKDLRLANRLFHPGRKLDWAQVERLLEKLPDDEARLRELRALRAAHPTHVRLALTTLALLEKTKQHGAAARLCAGVEGNPYADARLRTAVGEYWARRGQPARARRVFSEIVEFRPTDPLARRRLGDLYRAFGWYQEAYRQYQTLAALAPHDASVWLLMALAAAGAGRIDEALRLEQRVAASATGSGGAARWALLWSSVRLAQLRAEAREKKDDNALAQLIGRTRRSGVLRHARPLRVVLTWAHPEADLELWGAHPNWRPQRANELAPQFGIEAFAVRKPKDGTYRFEVRRVGARRTRTLQARLYVLWDEGKPTEKLQRFPLTLKPETKAVTIQVKERTAEVVK